MRQGPDTLREILDKAARAPEKNPPSSIKERRQIVEKRMPLEDALKIVQRRAEVLYHTPRNPFTGENISMPGYDMRPWWDKNNYPEPYVMTSMGMPDYPHWTETIAKRVTEENNCIDVTHSLPSFEGWDKQKEKKTRVAVGRILDRGWYSPHAHKLCDEDLRHMHALREHFSMRRNKVQTPSVGENTMAQHEWHSNMNALTVLSHGHDIGSVFRQKVDAVQRQRAMQRGHPSPPRMPVPGHLQELPICLRTTAPVDKGGDMYGDALHEAYIHEALGSPQSAMGSTDEHNHTSALYGRKMTAQEYVRPSSTHKTSQQQKWC